MGGDLPELDDCEEDDHFDPDSKWDDEIWMKFTPEDIEEFKILGQRLEQEEVSLGPRRPLFPLFTASHTRVYPTVTVHVVAGDTIGWKVVESRQGVP